jgi:hypothetical protein
VLDGALLQMIEHLVARRTRRPRGGGELVEVVDVEVADAPGEDLAGAAKLLEGRDRLGQGMRAPPVQEIAVEAVRPEPGERALAGRDGALARGVVRQDLRDQEDLVAPPEMASPTSSSAAPEPYISAVSMCVAPRSSPRRRAATASARGASSRFQVPWPTTATGRFVVPKGSCRMG